MYSFIFLIGILVSLAVNHDGKEVSLGDVKNFIDKQYEEEMKQDVGRVNQVTIEDVKNFIDKEYEDEIKQDIGEETNDKKYRSDSNRMAFEDATYPQRRGSIMPPRPVVGRRRATYPG